MPKVDYKLYYKEHRDVMSARSLNRYYENKQKCNDRHKEYYLENREYLRNKANTKYQCECGGRYSYSTKSRHLKSNKHIKFTTPL